MPQHNNLNPGDGFDFAKSYKNAPSRQNTVWDYQASRNPNVRNRFNNYEHEFDFDSIKKELGDVYSGHRDIINRDSDEFAAKQQKGSASRFASRGITGGSIIDDQMASIASKVGKSKSNALSRLGIGKAGDLAGLMDKFNKYKIQTEGLGTNVDKFNVNSQYRKGQGLAGYDVAWQEQDRANEMMPGWLEDLMSMVGDVGGLIPGVGDAIDLFSKVNKGGPAQKVN